MKKALLSNLLIFVTIFTTNCQNNSNELKLKVDLLQISKAEKLATKVLGIDYDKSTYIIFSVNDKMVLINKECNNYRLYSFIEEYNFEKQSFEFISKKLESIDNDKTLNEIFNSNICKTPFRYSSYYSKTASHDTDFIFYTKFINGSKKSEINIPTIYKNDSNLDESVFINQEYFNYLYSRLMM